MPYLPPMNATPARIPFKPTQLQLREATKFYPVADAQRKPARDLPASLGSNGGEARATVTPTHSQMSGPRPFGKDLGSAKAGRDGRQFAPPR